MIYLPKYWRVVAELTAPSNNNVLWYARNATGTLAAAVIVAVRYRVQFVELDQPMYLVGQRLRYA